MHNSVFCGHIPVKTRRENLIEYKMDNMTIKVITITLLLALTMPSISKIIENRNQCDLFESCDSCLSRGSCVWCVNKARCAVDSCGNDNIIYPSNIRALMSGAQFCPRVVLPANKLIVQSGKQERIVVKITQVYMYMAFTPWKCKFTQNGKDMVVNATLVADEVFCDVVLYSFTSPRADVNVSVLWEHNKAFDGAVPITVCRCDLDSTCPACVG